jgi:hypothetical protein
MPIPDFAQGITQSFPMNGQTVAWAQGTAGAKPYAPTTLTADEKADPSRSKSFLENVLDIVNPLEHLPVIGTIYSNLTGDKPGAFEKIAGDTLYGGPLGFVSSMAEVGFEKITGKDVGDTVWGWVTGNSGATALASTASKPTATATTTASTAAAPQSFTSLVAGTRAAPVSLAPAPAAPSAAPSIAADATGAPARLLNPLPARGAPPASGAHVQPSETKRAQAMATMMARRQGLNLPSAPAKPASSDTTQAKSPVASTTPAPSAPVASTTDANSAKVAQANIPTLDSAGEQALLAALNQNGVPGDIGQRALMAYQKSMAMNPDPADAASLSSVALH